MDASSFTFVFFSLSRFSWSWSITAINSYKKQRLWSYLFHLTQSCIGLFLWSGRDLDKEEYSGLFSPIFLVRLNSNPMLWVSKRIIYLRRLFWVPQHRVECQIQHRLRLTWITAHYNMRFILRLHVYMSVSTCLHVFMNIAFKLTLVQ